jgi:stage II sporulation protein D
MKQRNHRDTVTKSIGLSQRILFFGKTSTITLSLMVACVCLLWANALQAKEQTIGVLVESEGSVAIKTMPIDEYVKKVVVSEMDADWHLEALKVQAVLSRTYAIYHKMKNKKQKYDLTATTLHQVFDLQAVSPSIDLAVQETKGEVLIYKGKPIEAIFHSTCGGKTELPEEVWQYPYPYIKSLTYHDKNSPYYNWQRETTLAAIGDSLGIKGITNIGVFSHTKTGRVKKLKVFTPSKLHIIKSTALRQKLGYKDLPSAKFTVKVCDGKVIFEGQGYGHGVGLCQYGALQMALEGKTYREILYFFYPNTILIKK